MTLPHAIRWPLAGVLVAHGAIHALGFLWALDLADVEGIGGATLLFESAEPGDPVVVLLGLVWLVSMLALVAAGIGVASSRSWGLRLAGIAAAISLLPTLLWWSDAWIGFIVSAAVIVMAAVVAARGHTRGAMT